MPRMAPNAVVPWSAVNVPLMSSWQKLFTFIASTVVEPLVVTSYEPGMIAMSELPGTVPELQFVAVLKSLVDVPVQ